MEETIIIQEEDWVDVISDDITVYEEIEEEVK